MTFPWNLWDRRRWIDDGYHRRKMVFAELQAELNICRCRALVVTLCLFALD